MEQPTSLESSRTAPSQPPLQVQAPPPEVRFQEELTFLEQQDPGRKPPGWRLTPRALVTFICGSGNEVLHLPKADAGQTWQAPRAITQKFVGERALVERCVVTLAGDRGLLLVGEPGTAKSMLSELLAAASCGSSAFAVQGTAGTQEEQLRYSWNYAMLLARGPVPEALVPSPILAAMRMGKIARVEEITRCLPEVQDALVSILSDRRLAIPELTGPDGGTHLEHARTGFNVIATANLRDRGVSELSAALKRRFSFEVVPPIADPIHEQSLVRRQARAILEPRGETLTLDDAILEALVTAFRDLRLGRTEEGWAVERPSTVMSTAEAVGAAASLSLQASWFAQARMDSSDSLIAQRAAAELLPSHLLGVVLKDDPKDRGRLLGYWDSVVKRRAEQGSSLWKLLLAARSSLEEGVSRG